MRESKGFFMNLKFLFKFHQHGSGDYLDEKGRTRSGSWVNDRPEVPWNEFDSSLTPLLADFVLEIPCRSAILYSIE